MRYLKCLIMAASTLALLPTDALAWGKTGHRVTGQIAQEHLSRKAEREIQKILGVEDLAESSTWPDFMRSSRDEFWTDEAGPYHYVTIPKGKTYEDVGAPEKDDAITALKSLRPYCKTRPLP